MSRSRLTARFTPDPAPENAVELPGYLTNALSSVSSMINSPTRNFAPLNEAPPKPTDGDVAFANGDGWDPGFGAGLYVYAAGEWVALVSRDTPGMTPIGGIIIWTGSTVPDGWTLCDGIAAPNGMECPDLQSRFLKGAGTVAVGTIGGSTTTGSTSSGLPAHSHSGPSHSHTQAGTFSSNYMGEHNHGGFNYVNSSVSQLVSGANWAILQCGPTASIGADGNHAHSTTISGQTGGGGTGETGGSGTNSSHNHTMEPVYYAVAYIMRYE